MTSMEKDCRRCTKTLPLSDFRKKSHICKVCQYVYIKERVHQKRQKARQELFEAGNTSVSQCVCGDYFFNSPSFHAIHQNYKLKEECPRCVKEKKQELK